MSNISNMVGKVFTSVKNIDNDELIFTNDTEIYRFFHWQDCCEDVSIADITGDLSDLENAPIVIAEESTQEGENTDWESTTWTFYKFATIKGYVDVRWFGTSNGYYSESVNLEVTKR